MKIDEKGFSVAELLIMVLVVGLIGAVGWLVYDRQKSKTADKTSTNTTSQANNKTEEIVDKYANWSTYKDDYVSFKYPKDWAVTKRYTFSDPYGAHSVDNKRLQ